MYGTQNIRRKEKLDMGNYIISYCHSAISKAGQVIFEKKSTVAVTENWNLKFYFSFVVKKTILP